MSREVQRPILIVEDSHEDFAIVERALGKAAVTNSIFRCRDGYDALDYLHHRGNHTDVDRSPRPAVILLDLNLPGMSGVELLETVKADDRFKEIPVVVLTTSADGSDVRHCYALGAAGYIKKPIHPAMLVKAFQNFAAYWFETVSLPQ